MTDHGAKEHNKNEDRPIVVRNTTDLQRLKLEKLMKNPDKPVVIPEKAKGRTMPPVPDFVRNVMGSSAGAGSGEFHVYRHLRRKEYARQKFIQEKSEREKLDDEYHDRIEENKRLADEKTAKKRAKRQKKKLKAKEKGRKKVKVEKSSSESSDKSESETEIEENENHPQDLLSTSALENNAAGQKCIENKIKDEIVQEENAEISDANNKECILLNKNSNNSEVMCKNNDICNLDKET